MVDDKILEKFGIEKNGPPPFFCSRGTRKDLAVLFSELGYTRGAEIGVHKGYYSTTLCKTIPSLKLICVDPWESYNRKYGPKKMEKYYQNCVNTLSPYGAEIMRMKSVEAAKIVPDNSLDFVYIDAAHDYDNVMADITAWDPKVRVGGIVSGDDYDYTLKFGVIEAVDKYARDHCIESYYITQSDFISSAPSWFWVKK